MGNQVIIPIVLKNKSLLGLEVTVPGTQMLPPFNLENFVNRANVKTALKV